MRPLTCPLLLPWEFAQQVVVGEQRGKIVTSSLTIPLGEEWGPWREAAELAAPCVGSLSVARVRLQPAYPADRDEVAGEAQVVRAESRRALVAPLARSAAYLAGLSALGLAATAGWQPAGSPLGLIVAAGLAFVLAHEVGFLARGWYLLVAIARPTGLEVFRRGQWYYYTWTEPRRVSRQGPRVAVTTDDATFVLERSSLEWERIVALAAAAVAQDGSGTTPDGVG